MRSRAVQTRAVGKRPYVGVSSLGLGYAEGLISLDGLVCLGTATEWKCRSRVGAVRFARRPAVEAVFSEHDVVGAPVTPPATGQLRLQRLIARYVW